MCHLFYILNMNNFMCLVYSILSRLNKSIMHLIKCATSINVHPFLFYYSSKSLVDKKNVKTKTNKMLPLPCFATTLDRGTTNLGGLSAATASSSRGRSLALGPSKYLNAFGFTIGLVSTSETGASAKVAVVSHSPAGLLAMAV